MKRLLTKPAALALLIFFTPLAIQAQERHGTDRGLSCRIQGGAVYIQTNSQLSTESANAQTSDLDGPAETHEKTTGIASLYMNYRFDDGTALYFGNPLEVGEGLSLKAGVSHPLEFLTLDVALTYLPVGEVWKNPYLTNGARQKSDIDVHGMEVLIKEIADSPWEVSYKLNRVDIKNDDIGALEGDLDRSGQTHEVGLKYTMTYPSRLSIRPELSYTYANLNGPANRYEGLKLGVLLQQASPPWMFIGVVSGFYNQYEKQHPLFGNRRQEEGLTTFAQVMRLNLFGSERLFASVGAGYVWSNANIDFFDSQTLIGLASAGVNF